MNNLIVLKDETPMMTSLQLVEFINAERKENAAGDYYVELAHRSFMAKVPEVLGEGCAKYFADYPHPQNGQIYQMYCFPKREACLMAMSYSYSLQAKVFDRMTALELVAVPALTLPQSFSQALRLAAEQAETIERQEIALIAAQPAIQMVERYVEAKSSKCLSDVAKILGWKPQTFINRLSDDGVIFKRSGSWVPYQPQIDSGRFTVKTGESNGHAFHQTRVEPVGIEWLARNYGESK